jgi:adenine deaminase
MRYGGLDEQEALKLVTLNPARQLGIDRRVGALAAGMDADFVLWSEHPLSSIARAEQTWIDGRRYFDRGQDARDQSAIVAERERLIALAAVERAKALSLQVDATKAADEAKDDRAKSADAAPASDPDWLLHRAAERGIYHDGADLSSCGMHDHAH